MEGGHFASVDRNRHFARVGISELEVPFGVAVGVFDGKLEPFAVGGPAHVVAA